MKKILLFFTLISIFFPIFAFESFDVTSQPYIPLSTNSKGMGNTYLSYPDLINTIQHVPSALSNHQLLLSIPSVTVSINNLQAIFSNPNSAKKLEDFLHGNSNRLVDLAYPIISNLGRGNNKIASVDSNIGISLNGIGISFDLQANIHSKTPSRSFIDTNLIPEINSAISIGYGYRIFTSQRVSFDIGASMSFVYKAYLTQQNATKVVAFLDNPEGIHMLLENEPLISGWALPFNLSISCNLLHLKSKITAALNNINGHFQMKTFPGLSKLNHKTIENEIKFKINTPIQLDIGYGIKKPISNNIVACLMIDFKDIFNLFPNDSILAHTNVGLELQLFKMIKTRIGISKGYYSIGAELNFHFFTIEAAYYLEEYGEKLSDKPVDTFSIRVTLIGDLFNKKTDYDTTFKPIGLFATLDSLIRNEP